MADYKPFLIAVGSSGSYSSGISYEPAFDTKNEYGLYIKHSPFTFRPRVKNIITQEWIDQDGEDVFIPETITHESYDFVCEFVYCRGDGMANENILNFLDRIEGKWFMLYDTYTNQGRQGVYFVDYNNEPTFQRRGLMDVVIFSVTFRVNDPDTNIVLQEGV